MNYYLVKKKFNDGRDGITHYVGEKLEYKNESMVINQNGELVFRAGSDNFRNMGELVEHNYDTEPLDNFYDYNYETEPIGGGNPYHRCVHCGISTPQINGNLKNHSESCEYRIEKESQLELENSGAGFLFRKLTSFIESYDGNSKNLVIEEEYISLKNKINELIQV